MFDWVQHCGSTWGKGKTMPDPKQSIKLGDVTVPLGKPVLDTGVRNQGGFTLQYNEYVVCACTIGQSALTFLLLQVHCLRY